MTDFELGTLFREILLPPFLSRSTPADEKSNTDRNCFSREFELLVTCINGAKAEAIRQLIPGDLDWQALARITEHHRLIPQVYSSLCDVADLVPGEVLEKLRRLYEANVRQSLRLSRDLIRVLDHFEDRGVAVLAYKGPTLDAMLHGIFSQRQFVDIDLLVHPSDVQNSKTALIELRYIVGNEFTPRQEKSYVRSGYEYVFDLPDARNILELKWRILPHFYTIDFDVSGFFDRSVALEVGGRSMRTLCPEDLLLVLCVHAAKHAWAELSLLYDISQLIQSQPIKWDRVLEHACQLRIRRIVAVNLILVQNLLGIVLPVTLEKQEEAVAIVRKIVPRIAESREVDTESACYFRLMVDVRERLRDRVRFLWRLIFTPSMGEWETVRLPAWLFPLYHVVRMYRLSGRLLKYSLEIFGAWPRLGGRARSAAVP